jgi:membrane protein insertase, YidC/Oxa1 family, C-terminal domain
LLRSRKWLILPAAAALLLLAGCAPVDHTTSTEDLLEGNFWERNVVYWFAVMLDTFADWFQGNYVLSVLILTIIVRTLILPLTLKQYRSSKAMQALQPELAKIREKYKNNPQKVNEETMKLFMQHQVNPMAGCLPLLIQMPIFIALYNAIYWNPAIREYSFLGIQLGLAPQQQGVVAWLLPVIAAITTYIQSKMMPQQATGAMQAILMIFPVMIFVMALSFPAALPLYWIFSNIYTIVQNYFLYVRSSDKGKPKEAPAK